MEQTITTLSGLTSGSFADTLDGGSGNDTLNGGAGNDILDGGADQDTLTGGTGIDTFVFNATSESSTTIGLADVITDFAGAGVVGGDIIDLSGIDANLNTGTDDAFVVAGAGTLGVAVANSITWTQSGLDTILQIDNTGDTTVDMVIVLQNFDSTLTPLTDAGDFIL